MKLLRCPMMIKMAAEEKLKKDPGYWGGGKSNAKG